MSSKEKAKRISRRQVFRYSAAMAGVALLTACAPEVPATPTPAPLPTSAGTPAAAGKAPVVLRGATLKYLNYGWFATKLNDTFRNFAVDWATQNGVKFDLETIGTGDVAPRVATVIETKQGPNIVQLLGGPASIAGAAVDLTDVAEYVASQQEGWYAPAPFGCVVDGKWLAIPFGGWAAVVNYREDWFKEAGYDKFPDTWDDCLAAGKKLKAAGHPYGYSLTGSSGDGVQHALPILWAFGGKEFNRDGSIALDSKETLAALEFAIQFYRETCDPGVVAYTDPSNNQAFLAGQISMTLNVNTIYLPARDSNPTLAKAMNHSLPPRGPAGRFIAELVPSVAVLNHTQGRDLDAAKQFLRDFFSPTQYAKFIKDGEGYLLPLAPIYESLPVWSADPKLAIAREAGKIGRPSGFDLPAQSKLSTLMYNNFVVAKMFSQACSTGNARAALDAALKTIEDLKKQT